MKNKLIAGLLTLTVIVSACQQEDTPRPKTAEEECLSVSSSRNGDPIEGQFIVRLASVEAGAGRQEGVAKLVKENLLSKDAVLERLEGVKTMYRMQLSKEQAATLQSDPRVEIVEPDRVISVCGCFSVIEPRTVTWNVNKVGFGNGTGKTAWVIDTGIDSDHPDLLVDKARSKSFVDGSDYEDDNGHGTHVAGIIAALNNDIGTLGVASGASLVSLKVLGPDGEGKLSSVLNALNYVRTHARRGDVVNISIGFDETSEILEREIESISSLGIYFALAAGNESGEASRYSPARARGKNIFTVAAVDSLNRYASFSNYGSDVVDYAAPGVRILSTYSDGRYAILSGTSQAAPHVAGILLINNGIVNSRGVAGSDPDGDPDKLAHR